MTSLSSASRPYDSRTHDPRSVRRGIVVLCIAILAADLYVPAIAAVSGLYAVPILMSLWLARPRTTLALAILCTLLGALALLEGLLRDVEHDVPRHQLVLNHAVVIVCLWIIVSLGLMRLRIERELAESRETTATTLRSIAEAVITTDPEGRVSFVNAVAERLTGWTAEQAQGLPLEAVFRVTAERPMLPPLEELPDAATGPVLGRAKLVTRNDQQVPIEVSRASIRDDVGGSRGSVVVFRDVSDRERREEDMKRLAYRDELTGLPNRNSLGDRLALELAHARRNRDSLAVLFVDLDDFKRVNDAYGHHAGDELLRAVAGRLRSSLRECDTVARLGGDEFTVLLPGVGNPRDAERVADKLLEALEVAVPFEGRSMESRASIGIALYPRDGSDAESLVRRADEAMYRAKQLGGSRHVTAA